MSRRVVITGTGLVTALGQDTETCWDAMLSGKPGVSEITQFDASEFPCKIAAEIKDFNVDSLIEDKDLKRYDRFSLVAIKAAAEAFAKANLDGSEYDFTRMGTIVGVGIGGLRTLEDNHTSLSAKGPKRVSPFLIPAMISNLAPGHLGIRHNLRGINYTVTSACTSGTHAIGEGFRLIREGLQDLVICGGAESSITPLGVAGFARMRALSTRNDEPEKASRPFDVDRDGFVMGEGAGLVVLEDYDYAVKRGANIIAEVTGYGFSCDAYHITAPPEDGSGAVQSMKMALEFGSKVAEDIDYVNAHGTSTPINDPAETAAIKKVFAAHAKEGLAVSSTKSMLGHTLGAAGGVEGVILALAIRDQVAPPTINLDKADPNCDLDYIPNEARKMRIRSAISNSFGFGGTNATILVSKAS